MAVLERVQLSAGEQFQEVRENFAVSFEIGWKLKEDRTQSMRIGQGTQCFKEPLHLLLAGFQPANVRQALIRLGGKAKVGRRGTDPAVECASPRIGAEGVVHFNCIELSGVMIE